MTVPLHMPDIFFFGTQKKIRHTDMEQHEVDGDNRIFHFFILAVNTSFNT